MWIAPVARWPWQKPKSTIHEVCGSESSSCRAAPTKGCQVQRLRDARWPLADLQNVTASRRSEISHKIVHREHNAWNLCPTNMTLWPISIQTIGPFWLAG